MLRYFIRMGVHDARACGCACVARTGQNQGYRGGRGKHTRRIITPVPFPLARCHTVATTINLWRVMAQARFCLNGQPCNSWTRVTAGTDAPGILRGYLRRFSVDAANDDGGLHTVHPVCRARICRWMRFYDL